MTPMICNPSDRPTVVLVDAVSTGAMLARHAARRARCVHVRSHSAMPAAFTASYPAEVFVDDLAVDAHGWQAVVGCVASYRPVAVIAASELGVETADRLAAELGLPGNDPSLSAARRDKFQMVEAVAAAGLPVARQHRSGDLQRLLSWRKQHGGGRVVVKPLDSAGSDNVHLCEDDTQVEAAFRSIIGEVNLMLRPNTAVLGQEYLDGDEYVVNSVSREGRHWVTDVWRCTKALSDDGRKIYDHEDLLSPADPALASIVPYVSGVLDALAIAFGPAHTELILTADGPRLLETGARVSGLANPAALDRCTGANQVDLTLACHLDGAEELLVRPACYERLLMARCVSLISRRRVPLPAAAIRRSLRKLPAFDSVRFRLAGGATTAPTVDLNSSPGAVFLVHEDEAEIDRAYQHLRRLEREVL
jgi:biotin carboxylase